MKRGRDAAEPSSSVEATEAPPPPQLSIVLSGACTESLHLVHQCVLSLFDSPHFSKTVSNVFVEVKDTESGQTRVITVAPETRLPRTLLRFCGVVNAAMEKKKGPYHQHENNATDELVAVVRGVSTAAEILASYPQVFLISNEDNCQNLRVLRPARFGKMLKAGGNVAVVVPVVEAELPPSRSPSWVNVSLSRYQVASHISCSRLVLGLL